ncbi:MAG TPA: alanine--tRNA ligase [Candidatus Acidoferrales bacterium]|nr:alanine--tRNA ligase [Candidatus Acidoferrales bacterium]
MTGNEIRETFLRFFEQKGHKRVRSSSLVPVNDPTLLFTNAGMNQFKDVFLGLEQRDYKRATSSQKVVRAGGKHNDLENVGFTNRHNTFFEMLGNFSFGDYFKKDAIAFAWELMTSPNWFAIDISRLYVSIFKGEDGIPRDDDAYRCWLETGIARDRIYEFGAKDNFWAMGDTGPCGPCSEIYYDMGPASSDLGHADCKFGCDCGRYVENWNLVFMQFNRDASGKLNPLPKPCVDTGWGLERVACIKQNKISNFDTDLFQPLIQAAAKHAGVDASKPEIQPSLRIIADHSRAATFLIADGVVPSNEGRGYVLRKIIRRGLRHVEKLNSSAPRPFLSFMAGVVRESMGAAYPEIVETSPRVNAMLDAEESRFLHTVQIGLKHLLDDLGPLGAAKQGQFSEAYSGEKAFKLYDTYGLPRDFIEDVTRDSGINVDWAGFDRAMEEQRTRARASWKGGHKDVANPVYAKLAEKTRTKPDFYTATESRDARIEAIITKNGAASEIPEDAEAEIVLDHTAIYSESGGQVADIGKFYDNAEAIELADVKGAYYPVAGLIAHRVLAKDTLRVGDRVATVADGARREHIKRNHTATHLMHAALRNILGTHVKQAGSLVEPLRLRFDFSHFAPVDAAELRDIEQQVTEEILLNNELETAVMPLDEALASGALAFFGDRYPETNVRVVTIPDKNSPRGFYSKELCGGTHVRRSGDIGIFKIVAESSVAAGVRRIEAISGVRGIKEFQRAEDKLRSLAATLSSSPDDLEATAQKLIEARRELEKQLNAAQRKSAQSGADDLVAQAQTIKGVRLISAQVPEMSRDALRGLVDTLRQKLGSGVVVLGMAEDGKVALIGGVTKDLTAKLHAGKIIQAIAKEVGGSGGGRPDLAEAGGKDTVGLNRALVLVSNILSQLL